MQASKRRWWFTPLILLIIIILLHLLVLQPLWIENIYSADIYPPVSFLIRILTRWIPFSIGDIIYSFVFIWFLVKTIRFFIKRPTWQKFFLSLRNLLVKCLWVYMLFLLLWGLNYYRYGIGYKLGLIPDRYSTKDLVTVTVKLRDQLNANRKLIDSLHINYTDDKTTFRKPLLYMTQQK
jgi:hypothetical protein